ncbi:hypothetical protein, partial [Aliiruegeria sabulilitoris]|uniref:hypothetical protein n=1 Tax=Aliiruegeria sabulilitoris TaxID=1510458 RepID=UPI001E620EAC
MATRSTIVRFGWKQMHVHIDEKGSVSWHHIPQVFLMPIRGPASDYALQRSRALSVGSPASLITLPEIGFKARVI